MVAVNTSYIQAYMSSAKIVYLSVVPINKAEYQVSVKHSIIYQIQPEYEDEQADAGRDG